MLQYFLLIFCFYFITLSYNLPLARYVSALISGVGIFCLGAGLSVYHGVLGLQSPDHSLESLPLAMAILGISFLSESVTLGLAIRSIRRSARSVGRNECIEPLNLCRTNRRTEHLQSSYNDLNI